VKPLHAQRPAAPAVEVLEDRRLFSVFSFGFGSDLDSSSNNTIGLPGAGFFLPSPALGLPIENLALPQELLALPGPGTPITTGDVVDLRGHFRGSANVTGFGTTTVDLNITRQRRGTITGTLSLPDLGRTFSGKAPVTFLGNRRFQATFTRGTDTATLTARLNRDGTLTGEFTAITSNQRFDGTLNLARVNA
jgi:hypothetical protein